MLKILFYYNKNVISRFKKSITNIYIWRLIIKDIYGNKKKNYKGYHSKICTIHDITHLLHVRKKTF